MELGEKITGMKINPYAKYKNVEKRQRRSAMPTCLGLYIEKNIMKYAKVSKDNGIVKVEAFGIKFFEKLEETIKQVVSETFSYKIPIYINSSNEQYNYFSIINLLNAKDLKKVIATEFEGLCEEKGQNKTAFETRYLIADDAMNSEKVKVIHIASNKAEITRKKALFEGNRLQGIIPLPISLSNLVDEKQKENVMIINLEEHTTITEIINQKIYHVERLERGINEVLEKIQEKENSYSKAYEICKNTTIYTSEAKDLQIEENPYLEDIMPVLYAIVEKITQILNNTLERIDKVYITGTASVINNIDLYFEQYMPNVKCEVLKPYFLKENYGIPNIKDYIEVNSAIALGLQGVGVGFKSINLIQESFKNRLPEWMTKEIGGNKKTGEGKKVKLENDFISPVTQLERNLIRSLGGCLLLFIVYICFSAILTNQTQVKQEEIAVAEANIDEKIQAVQSDITTLSNKTNEYVTAIENLKKINEERAEIQKNKKAIPVLLSQIMDIIPKQAQITSIENTQDKKIVINAQAENYEYLGYLNAKIKADNILVNVVSSSGQKQDGIVKVTIEGELP